MKIVAWVHGVAGPHNAGSELMLHHMLRWFVERGHEADVYAPADLFPVGPFKLEGVRCWPQPDADTRQQIFREADVILSHYKPSPLVARWAREVGRPVVHIVHNPSNFNTYRIQTGDIDLALVNSYSMALVGRSYQGAVMTLYPPVFERDYPLCPGGDRVTLINLNNNKGGPLFWKIAQADKQRLFLGVKGVYPKGQQQTMDLPNVAVMENVADMSTVYKQTRVLLIPSDHEAWGRVAVEAMWSGVPMVANSLQKWNGFFECVGQVPVWAPREEKATDVAEWIKAIRSLDHDGLYDKKVQAGRSRAQQIQEETIRQLEAVERQLMAIINRHHTRRVVAFGAEPHYIDHVSTSLHQLHPDALAPLVVPESHAEVALRRGHAVIPYPDRHPETVSAAVMHYANPAQSVALVASKTDHLAAQKMGFMVVRCEHGVGQTYIDGDSSGSYAGSTMHGNLFAFHAPGAHPFNKQRAGAPHVLAQRVGCPWLDSVPHKMDPKSAAGQPVGFGFHWDNTVRPETSATWKYWLGAVREMARHREVWVTCHPREFQAFVNALELPTGGSIKVTHDLREMHQRVGVFCADNTSALYLMAALGHPVVVLNHPSYRDYLEHGLRFWDAADVGIQCGNPEDLEDAVAQAEECDREDMFYREEALRWVFYRTSGASVIEALLLESYLDFLGDLPTGVDDVWVLVKKGCVLGNLGSIIKGRTYLLPRRMAAPLLAKGSAVIVDQPAELRKYKPTFGVRGMEPRNELDYLLRVRETFEADGVRYKPGDLVVSAKIPEELRQKCSKYAPKRRVMEDVEFK